MKNKKECIERVVGDLVTNFLYYDRKGDEELPVGTIEEAVVSGEISVDDLVAKFRERVEEYVNEYR